MAYIKEKIKLAVGNDQRVSMQTQRQIIKPDKSKGFERQSCAKKLKRYSYIPSTFTNNRKPYSAMAIGN